MNAALFGALLAATGVGDVPSPRVRLATSDLFPDNSYLVGAVALTPRTFKVSRVYVGPASLKDQTCAGDIFITRGIKEVRWPIRPGEECLCWIVKTDKDGKLVLRHASPLSMSDLSTLFVPVKKSDKEFDHFTALAQFYEKVYLAKEDDRFEIIDKYLRSKDAASQPFFWLVCCKKAEVKAYLRELALDQSAPVPAQILSAAVMDGAAMSADEHKKALARWLREKWRNPPYESFAEDSLSSDVAVTQYASRELIDLLLSGLANPERSKFFARSLLWRLQLQFSEKAARDRRNAALTQLMDTLSREQPKAIQVAAVRLLEVFDPVDKPLNEEELAKLHAILPKLSEEAKELLLRRLQVGMKIREVFQFGPAWGAGLHEFDVIIDAGGRPVRSFDELAAALADANGAVDLVVIRGNGKREKVSVIPRAGKIGVSVEEQRPVRNPEMP